MRHTARPGSSIDGPYVSRETWRHPAGFPIAEARTIGALPPAGASQITSRSDTGSAQDTYAPNYHPRVRGANGGRWLDTGRQRGALLETPREAPTSADKRRATDNTQARSEPVQRGTLWTWPQADPHVERPARRTASDLMGQNAGSDVGHGHCGAVTGSDLHIEPQGPRSGLAP